MKKNTPLRAFLAAVIIVVCLPVALSRDFGTFPLLRLVTHEADSSSPTEARVKLSIANTTKLPVISDPVSVKIFTPPVFLAVSGTTSYAASSLMSLTSPTRPVREISSTSPSVSTIQDFVIAPGFGAGGAAPTNILATLGGGSAAGRDVDDETCPLIDRSNSTQP